MPKKRSLSLYWKCQLIGWSVASLYWGLMGMIGTNFSWWLAIIHFISDLLIYILPTHLYRNLSLHYQWQRLSTAKLLPRIIPATIVLGGVFMVLTIGKNYTIRWLFEPGFGDSFLPYLKQSGLTTYATGIRLMSIWILAYYGYHFAQREINASKESARLALIAKDAQLENLTAQLNPHFFFNSLNNIKALVIEDPQAARRAIDLLSDLLRTSLYGRNNTLITLRDEMSLINDYVELEKMRFEKRLQVVMEVDDQLLHVSVLPLSIQSLVENAIKHGISQKKNGGTIHIKIERKGDCIQATIQNPGKLETATSTGLGLKNLTERLQLRFNGKAAFRLTQQPDETVLATVSMPLS